LLLPEFLRPKLVLVVLPRIFCPARRL